MSEQIKTWQQRVEASGRTDQYAERDYMLAELAELRALSRRPAAAPEDAQQAFKDAMLHGTGAYLQKPNGSTEHIAPEELRIAAAPLPVAEPELLTEAMIDKISHATCTSAKVVGGTMCHIFKREDWQNFGRIIEQHLSAAGQARSQQQIADSGDQASLSVIGAGQGSKDSERLDVFIREEYARFSHVEFDPEALSFEDYRSMVFKRTDRAIDAAKAKGEKA